MDKSGCGHIGTLVKLYGYKGGFVLALDSYLGDEIENWESVFIDIDGLLVPFFIDTIDLIADTTAIVTFDDLTSEGHAKKLLQCEVYQLKSMLHPEVTGSTDRLTGYMVIDRLAGRIGSIDGILEYRQNLLFRIVEGNREILVPMAEEIIEKVDHKKKVIWISAPEGLLDLNNSSL